MYSRAPGPIRRRPPSASKPRRSVARIGAATATQIYEVKISNMYHSINEQENDIETLVRALVPFQTSVDATAVDIATATEDLTRAETEVGKHTHAYAEKLMIKLNRDHQSAVSVRKYTEGLDAINRARAMLASLIRERTTVEEAMVEVRAMAPEAE
jgi:stress response protein YsnF